MKELYYAVFETRLGWMGVLSSIKGLLWLKFPVSTYEVARKEIGQAEGWIFSPPKFSGLISRLQDYTSGIFSEFPDELDLSGATAFQRKVWNTTRLIPYGETRSYGWIARFVDNPRGPRAVGQALGRNPLPIIIPCHRVLASRNTLGGFTGGLQMKQRLLNLEGITYG
ncbi:methylated-DNA--[protein]-cysteine S-methyltransferase [Chloroflexota bacterium]